MQPYSLREIFAIAAPRRAAVLCLPGPNGSTDMILTQWFTWLNIKRQPMLTYAMERAASLGLNVDNGGTLYLAFPPTQEALKYRWGVRTAENGQEKKLPEGVTPARFEGLPIEAPCGSEIILRCTLANAYNYPFKKVRIFNCNLEEAIKGVDDDDSGSDQPIELV